MPLTPGFTGSTLDRADHLRDDEAAVADLKSGLNARLLRMHGLDPVPDEHGELGWGSLAEAPEGVDLALLGFLEGKPRFVALQPRARGGMGPGLWNMIGAMPPGQAATYAAARSLIDWHARHRFCAACGADTSVMRAGWGRKCGNCSSEHFPRTDPVVIMLAEHQGRVLLGRQPRFPAGNYSALAGFLEVGESIEEAVARELFEEAGVRARKVRYVVSQPWPFPSSLMIACIAEVEGDTITLDTKELEDAVWATKEDVRAALDNAADRQFSLPPPMAIANTLCTAWVDGL